MLYEELHFNTYIFKTLHTLQHCISDTSYKIFSIPLDFAYNGFASVTAGSLSKVFFFVFVCVCFLNMHSTKYNFRIH